MDPEKNELWHFGTKRHSGRYPWGSGERYERSQDFRMGVINLKKQGMSEAAIAKAMGVTDLDGKPNTAFLRDYVSLATNQERLDLIYRVNNLRYDANGNEHNSASAIAKMVGKNESTIREILNPLYQEKAMIMQNTENMLKEQIKDKKYLDVGAGIELQVGVSRKLLDTAIFDLEHQGFESHNVSVTQVGTGKETWMKVMTEGDVSRADVYKNRDKIQLIDQWTNDNGETFLRPEPVKSIDSSRVLVKYDEDGGTDRDGIISLRRGVPDLDLGDKRQAQVRVAVDDKYFLKGMAAYYDDIPDGYDIVYNTSKHKADGPFAAMKKYDVADDGTVDPTNPFGTTIRQVHYTDKDGNDQLSPLNRVGYSTKVDAGEEGAWESWHTGKALASQFLAKQDVSVAKEQLNLAVEGQKEIYDNIQKVTNPIVKQKLLDSYADDCDAKAVKLEGAALPRQAAKVLFSEPSMKPNQVFAPGYKDGEEVGLIRYPHAGTFEIPVLTVNNKNPLAKKTLGTDNRDAIMLHPSAMAKMSGADSDGDSAIIIPWNDKMKASESLKGLKDFNPKIYKYPKEITNAESFKDKTSPIHKMTDREKGREMGGVSNLITDMNIKKADPDELARAVRHSMVVIDAQKHDLDWKASARSNGIAQLKSKYQGGANAGAATLLSRATSRQDVLKRRPLNFGDPGYEDVVRRSEYSVDKETGRKVYAPVAPKKPYINSKGELYQPKPQMIKSKRMAETEDAFDILKPGYTPTPVEKVYGDFANSMKALGNKARKESINLPNMKVSPSAKKAYMDEVNSLNAKLRTAERNAPLERQAQLVANTIVNAQKLANPNLTNEQLKKIKGQAIETARNNVGAGKQRIQITEREWEAVESGAVTSNVLRKILSNTDIDAIQKLATPREQRNRLSTSKIATAKARLARGYTLEQVAAFYGISESALKSMIY